MQDNILLEDCWEFATLELNESTADGKTRFRGIFSLAEEINKNKRRYPRTVLEQNVGRLVETIEAGGLVGELDHAQDSIIHFERASHLITKLWWDNDNPNKLVGEAVILSTPMGKVLKSLINDGVRIGISSRGVGNGKVDENGVLVIGESYRLITWDCVADPSTSGAFQERVKKETYKPSQNSVIKNTPNNIYSLKEAVIAAVGGLVKNQTAKIKKL